MMLFHDIQSTTECPHRLPRQCMSDKDGATFYGRIITLLAGIRADGTALIAFPSVCSNAQWP
jgi:hypothetical protein